MKNLYTLTLFSIIAGINLHAAHRYSAPFAPCELLENAIKNNTLEEVQQLLNQHNIDINAPVTNDQETYLHIACWWGRSDVTHELLLRGAHLNAKNINGRTPLFYAISKDHTSLAQKLLLQKDIEINIKDTTKKTPLHIAASMGDTDIVTTLLNLNARTDAKDCFEQIPAQIAEQRGFHEIAKLINSYEDIPDVKEPEQK